MIVKLHSFIFSDHSTPDRMVEHQSAPRTPIHTYTLIHTLIHAKGQFSVVTLPTCMFLDSNWRTEEPSRNPCEHRENSRNATQTVTRAQGHTLDRGAVRQQCFPPVWQNAFWKRLPQPLDLSLIPLKSCGTTRTVQENIIPPVKTGLLK